ncbi:MAG: hypothetical protein ACLSUK_22560 [Hungatella sp.]|uniref:hypothetical protein n=1 Tax=Hungatella sp. TaxID=2613924 RepID=UPI0039931BF9
MSLKEEMAKHRKYEDLLKDQSPERTWAMDKPAYCYTAACPDPKLRKPIWRRHSRQPSIRAVKVEKICLICRKRWPAECGRKNCDCERQGHLYAIGGYNHPRIGGGTSGAKQSG